MLRLAFLVWFILGTLEAAEQTKSWQTRGILSALDDPWLTVRQLALQRLSYDPPADFDPARIAGFPEDPDPVRPKTTIQILGALRADQYSRRLVPLLDSVDSDIRDVAVRALAQMFANEPGRVRQARQIESVVKLLEKPSSTTRRAALEVLKVAGNLQHAQRIASKLDDPDDGNRLLAAEVLGILGVTDYSNKIEALIQKNPSVNIPALNALTPSARRPYLTEALEFVKGSRSMDPNAQRLQGIWGTIKDKREPIELLLPLVNHPYDEATQLRALSALNALDQTIALKHLGTRLHSSSREVLNVVLSIVSTPLARKEFASDVNELLLDPRRRGGLEHQAIVALQKMRAINFASSVALFLLAGPPSARLAAVGTLLEMGAIDDQQIASLLGDPEQVHGSAVLRLYEGFPGLFPLIQAGFEGPEIFRILQAGSRQPLSALKLAVYFHRRPRQLANTDVRPHVRFLCHYVSGGDVAVRAILSRTMLESASDAKPTASLDEARTVFAAFSQYLPIARTGPQAMLLEAEQQVVAVAEQWRGRWGLQDRSVVDSIANQLSATSRQAFLDMTGPSEESAKPMIAIVKAVFPSSEQSGAGILFSILGNKLYILTANHLVREEGRKPATSVKVRLSWQPEKLVSALVTRDWDEATDSAVLVVENASRLGIPFNLLLTGQEAPVKIERADRVQFIGRAYDDEWHSDYASIASFDETRIRITAKSSVVGYSGGALYDGRWRLIGMLIEDSATDATAVRLKPLMGRYGHLIERRP